MIRLAALLLTAAVAMTGSACEVVGGVRPLELRVEIVADGLVVPWSMAFAPDGRIFVTERPGRIRLIGADGRLAREPLLEIEVADTAAEGGLLGLALDPAFANNGRLYLYHTYRDPDGSYWNRVVRYGERDGRLADRTVILDRIPGGNSHDGGRMAFGPDGKLYVTTGEGGRDARAQQLDSLGGKILRIEADGSVPADNPLPGSPVYSYGHRNPQGLAWDPGSGDLYATEHGQSGQDELNRIVPGANYGWPVVRGEDHGEYRAPVGLWSPAIAPSGAAWYSADLIPQWRGSILFATLRGAHLRRVTLDRDGRIASDERLFEAEWGRLRDVVVGPDGSVYLLTSNRDRRAGFLPGDDRVLRIAPAR